MSQVRGAATAAEMLTLDFLGWLESSPRTYAETMGAWRTHCPRFSIWEDALAADLIWVEIETGTSFTQAAVTLTPRGRAVLNESSPDVRRRLLTSS